LTIPFIERRNRTSEVLLYISDDLPGVAGHGKATWLLPPLLLSYV